ncbi:MAG: D-3-phosphoglycerate dehydrogenase / 2-oxoglutarate reductase [Solirubrobacteraceae bacterium]|nr:D-3-phosphoglycerate dehydrogenase / 2-oxoglutarate reductase [Solirubrobacteraceae bacterium]
MRVLVAEAVGDSGFELLQVAGFDVDLGVGWTREELEQRIGDYEGILIRSATKLDADLIARAASLRVIARAGVGVDNIDVTAATKAGIVVANAPRSNIVTAAEHTMALLLSLARNIPQAHGSLTSGKWERSKFSGTELMDKTLGVLGFGRIGQLVATRARAFGMRVVAYDPYVAAERYTNSGVEKMDTSDDLYAQADFITIHLPNTPETTGWLDAAAFAKMRDGVRILNVARGTLIVDADLQAALDSGKVAGAALDVFQSEPITEHPLFHYPNVIVTPHLGASTAEATDRAGYQAAEQVVAALQGGSVTTAVNVPAIAPEDMEVLGPFQPLCTQLGRLGTSLARCGSIEQIEIECNGRIAERDTRPLGIAVLLGALQGRTEEPINDVNAHAIAEERGIQVFETSSKTARDFTDLVRVTVVCGAARTTVAGTTIGNRNRPHLLQAWGQRFNLQLEPHVTLFRYRDVPGVIGRVGTLFGAHGVNIGSAAVGHSPDNGDAQLAVMVFTTDVPVPQELVDEIVGSSEDFVDGRTVALG